MLIKQITQGTDFEKTLRLRRLIDAGGIVLGILGLVCYFTLVKGSDVLPDFAQGFYLGASGGVILVGLVFLCRTQHLLTHPEARKKAKVEELDERQKTIFAQAFQIAGMVTFFLAAAALIVLVAVDRAAALTVFCMVVVYAVVFLAAQAWLQKKL